MTENTLHNISTEATSNDVGDGELTCLSKYYVSKLVFGEAYTMKTFIPRCSYRLALDDPKKCKDHVGDDEYHQCGLQRPDEPLSHWDTQQEETR